ncbi:MAG: ATP-binding protein [Thermodesulfobacteriota bacterium]
MVSKFHSIPLKVSLLILCIETVLLALMGTYYVQRFDREIEQRVREKLTLPGILMSQRALNYDAVKDLQVIGGLVHEQVADAFIFRKDGRVFFSSESEREGKDFHSLLEERERELLVWDEGNSLQVSFTADNGEKLITSITPIHHSEQLLGHLYIKIYAANIEREKRKVLLLFVFGSVLTIVLTTLLEAFFVHRLFVPRIQQISATMEDVENGDLESRVRFRGPPDELQLLSQRVNTMIGAVAENIYEISATKGKLEKSEERFRELADLLPETIFELDNEGRVLYVNKQGEKIFQYSKDDVEGGIYSSDLVVEIDRDQAAELVQKRVRGEISGIVEYRGRRKDGSTFPVHINASAMYNRGELVGLRGVMVDITEKKHLQDKLLQAQKMEAIGRLSASIAHEFGNPLIGVYWLLQDLSKLQCLDEDTRKMTEVALQECRRMREFLFNFQRFSKRTTGRTELFDIHNVLDGCLLFYKKFIRDKDVSVVKQYATNLSLVHAIKDQINQVLVNLIMNGIEAMGESGGELVISTEAEQETIRVTIRDNGTGIKKENLVHVFEPFFSTKQEVKGMGLGLYVSYGIIQRHHGDIIVDSEYGQGTSFTVILPVAVVDN